MLAYLAWRKSRETTRKVDELHVIVNERLTEMLKATAAASKAEGIADERARGQSDAP